MLINIQDDIQKLQALGLLDKLLIDKTTKKNIMWATDAYSPFGTQFQRNETITADLLTGTRSGVIQNRAHKAMEQQSERTRQHAEVFTPLWVCKKMCDYADEIWDKTSEWQKYVDSRLLEITCGEAPFLVSRYDVETGESVPVDSRIGLLDRKLRAVCENAQDEQEWLKWAARAFQSVYGYEFQGDNLLIARVNLLMTFEEYLWERWHREPTKTEYTQIANTIAWNIWQMDGLTGTLPYSTLEEEKEIDWFGMFETDNVLDKRAQQPGCRIYNWRGDRSLEYLSIRDKGDRAMKFDFVIGNPPYQDESNGELRNFAPPIYHLFIDETYKIADAVELIHPARFLFNAGSTPKAWNEKMLQDDHLKVIYYEPDSSKVFPNLSTPIKGGIAVTYRNAKERCGAIIAFTQFPEVNSIVNRVTAQDNFIGLSQIVYSRTAYRLTDVLHRDYPGAITKLSNGHAYDMASNIFQRLPEVFFDEEPQDSYKYIRILGRDNNQRVYKFIRRDYANNVENLDSFKVYVAQASGSGAFGETMSLPIIGEPGVGATETFISIGCFDTYNEAVALKKYIKTKFARTLLSVLKVTQNGNKPVWRMIPLQDFTPASDIDWSKPIPEIDQQLYAKYGLDEKEIEFIETHVKEME